MVDFSGRDRHELLPVSKTDYFQPTTGKGPFKKPFEKCHVLTLAEIEHGIIEKIESSPLAFKYCNDPHCGYSRCVASPSDGIEHFHDVELGPDDNCIIRGYL